MLNRFVRLKNRKNPKHDIFLYVYRLNNCLDFEGFTSGPDARWFELNIDLLHCSYYVHVFTSIYTPIFKIR